MSQNQFNNFRLLKQILKELTKFGLNPFEWRIERQLLDFSEEIHLSHRHDENFQLSGLVSRNRHGRTQIISLAVASL